MQEHENHLAAATLENQLEQMAAYEMKHGSDGRKMGRDRGLSIDQVKYRLKTYQVIIKMLKRNASAKPSEPLPKPEPISVLSSSVVPDDISSSSRASPLSHSENSIEE